jgi:histidyl-tRNA synthetase
LVYADSKKIPFVIIAGENEIKNNEVTVKFMHTGEQKIISIANFKTFIISEMNFRSD